ncbi:hypothetical protein B0H13DRAFT_1873973 [Mycena leptocephala]|nr:hypothetical protein B0H13DRAFT_1873973 [Mycena leptocephala]
MDASATQRFLDTNVQWPSNRFFIPDGGLPAFLQSNLRFKVFLVMMAVFPDAYATDTVKSLTTPQRDELRYRTSGRRGIRWGRQAGREYWRGSEETTDGQIAHAQAGFLLGAALSTFLAKKKSGDEAHLDFPEYDANHWISANFAYRGLQRDYRRWREIGIGATARRHSCGHTAHTPVSCDTVPPGIPSRSSDSLAAGEAVRAAGFKATLQAVESVIKKTATRRSMRVLAARMGETQGPPDDFFVKEEERALSEASYGSMPGLMTPPASSASE